MEDVDPDPGGKKSAKISQKMQKNPKNILKTKFKIFSLKNKTLM